MWGVSDACGPEITGRKEFREAAQAFQAMNGQISTLSEKKRNSDYCQFGSVSGNFGLWSKTVKTLSNFEHEDDDEDEQSDSDSESDSGSSEEER